MSASGAQAADRAAAGPRALARLGRFFFESRNALFPLVFAAAAAAGTPRAFLGRESADRWLDAAGLLVIAAGQALRVAVIGLAYIGRGGKDGKIHADALVVRGFFAHSRNPLYVGNLLVYAGLFLVLNHPWGYAAGLPFFLFAYHCIVLAEEEFLRGRFGADFDDYRRRVPRYLPRLAGLRETLRSMRFDWRRVVRKEYSSTLAWITAALGLLVWQSAARGGEEAGLAALRRALWVWAPVVAAWAYARRLKKTGRLNSP